MKIGQNRSIFATTFFGPGMKWDINSIFEDAGRFEWGDSFVLSFFKTYYSNGYYLWLINYNYVQIDRFLIIIDRYLKSLSLKTPVFGSIAPPKIVFDWSKSDFRFPRAFDCSNFNVTVRKGVRTKRWQRKCRSPPLDHITWLFVTDLIYIQNFGSESLY